MKSFKTNLAPLSASIAIIVAFSASSVLAWTGPTQTAPGGNTPQPISTSSASQVKAGNFWASAIGSTAGFCISASCITTWPTSQWTIAGMNIYYTSGNVGIGTNAPVATLDINGVARLSLQSSAPITCDAAHKGSIAMPGTGRLCICNGTSWVFDYNGAACVWPVPDVVPPTVAITAPANGATVTGSATSVTATASDNVGVVGVQFKLDGANLSAEDLTSPYGITWDTTTATNGVHQLTAVARDAAGNTATSTAVSMTVANVSHGSQTFNATGADQYFMVPALVTSITATLKGAGGEGATFYNILGGSGGFTSGTISVAPGQVLTVVVGKKGFNAVGGYGGGGSTVGATYEGGGGGRSAIDTTGGTELIAAGGGGGGTYASQGGSGGGLQGGSPVNGSFVTGGSQTAPGSGGAFPGVGHNGGSGNSLFEGGGGGGWYGGGGGAISGGAGGSGYCGGAGVSACTTTTGAGSASDSNGIVTISW